MKSLFRIVVAVLALAVCMPVCAEGRQSGPVTVEINAVSIVVQAKANVYIRSGPGRENSKLGWMKKGDILRSTIADGEWTIVRYKGKEGFVLTKYLDELEKEPAIDEQVRAVAAASVYSGPSKYAGLVGKATVGETFPKLFEKGDWLKIDFHGRAAYVDKVQFEAFAGEVIQPEEGDQGPLAGNEAKSANPADTVLGPEGVYVEATAYIAVRSGPAVTSSELGRLYNGSIVPKLGVNGEWICIEYNNRMAYVEADYMQESAYTPDQAVRMGNYEQAALELIDEMNAYRVKENEQELEISETLMAAAWVRVQELTVSYGHTRPDGSACNSVAPEAIFGENIARGTALPIAASAAKGFISSEAHRINAMDSRHTKTGAACLNVNGMFYWVQLFGK